MVVLIAFKTLFQLGEFTTYFLAGCIHQLVGHAIKIEVAQCAIQVIGAANRTSGLHASKTLHCLTSKCTHQCLVTAHEGIHQNVHELFRSELVHSTSAAVAFALHLGVLHLSQEVFDVSVTIAIGDAVLRSAKTEVHLKDSFERTPVSVILYKSCTQRILERFAIL
ncbi:unannotated protein [freshwater metagenome]|uniref:Unannotated protein n=1 Tax=freshwater metagenome TaxID=449393 RepID=A0A6J6HQI8_9ZZZZ